MTTRINEPTAMPSTSAGIDMTKLVDLAISAGATILAIYADTIDVSRKGDGSPVTEADTRAEAVILKGLAEIAPDIPVVAEESVAAGRVPAPSARFFLVDPLDGTREFISRNGEFTVNIGLIENGAPVAGVVYAPALGEIFWGTAGEGAFGAHVVDGRIRRQIGLAPCKAAPKHLRAVASRSHMSEETRAFIERLGVRDFASAGSSLKFCKIAAGLADIYPRFGRTMEWDTAAADAVLRAAGGMVVTVDGAPLVYGKRDQAADSAFANPYFIAVGDQEFLSSIGGQLH